MSTLDQKPADLRGLRQSLQRRLDEFGRHVRARLMLEAAARWLALVLLLALITFILDRTLRLSHITRRGLLIAFLATAAIQAWRQLLAPLRLELKSSLLAAALGRKIGAPIAPRVATVLELPTQQADETSSAMIDDAVTRSHQSLANIDFLTHLDPQRRKIAISIIAGILIVPLGLIVVFPSTAALWAARLFAGSDRPWPQQTYMQVAGVKDGTMTVPRGEAFILRASAREGTASPDSVSIRWRQAGSSPVAALLTRFGANDFRYDFPPVQGDVMVEMSGGDDSLGPFTIHPVDRPRVVDLKLTTQHPTEHQPRTRNFSGDDADDLAFLPLTKMELAFTANVPISQVHFNSSTTKPSSADLRRINDRQFAVSWQHAEATQLQVELVSADAGLESPPTNVSIGTKSDKPPRVTLGFSGVRPRVTPQATIPLTAEAKDDYGVDHIELQTRTEFTDPDDSQKVTAKATTQPIFGPATQPADNPELEVRQAHPVSLAEMNLQPGHLLTFMASATDTSYPQHQTASSRQVTFRVVRPEELFKEILTRQQTERAKFRKQIDEARKVRDTLAAGQLIPETILQVSRQHRTTQREVNRIAAALSDSLTEMRLNVLGSDEARDLMENSILKPMKMLDAEQMNPQKDSLDSLSPSDTAAVATATQRQDEIIARMEEILRHMAQWDSFIDVLNQLNEIIRLENQVQTDTNKQKKNQTEGAFDP